MKGKWKEKFEVSTGVRQGCLLPPFLLLLTVDWIMTSHTNQKRNRIQWTLWSQLDDLDFADNLALLPHNYRQMQEKTSDLHHASMPVGVKLNKQKTKIQRINTGTNEPVTLEGAAFNTLKKVWNSREISTSTKVCLFNSNVKDVRANCFCASLLRTNSHATSCMSICAKKYND